MHDQTDRQRLLLTVLSTGAFIAAVDAVNATTFWWVYRAVPPYRIFQGIAAGLMGKSAFQGGLATAWLGGGLHLFIACTMVAAYVLVATRWAALVRRPVLFGLVYGAATYLVMNQVVVPLVRGSWPPFHPTWFIDSVLTHLFIVGLPTAFATRWAMRPGS